MRHRTPGRWLTSGKPLQPSVDSNQGTRTNTRKQPAQLRHRQRNAACGRREPVARDVDENGATASCNARTRVVVDLDDEIVERVLAREPVGAAVPRNVDMPVIATVARVFAPAVVRPDPSRRQKSLRPRMTVGAPPQAYQPVAAARRAAVALALVGANAAAAERNGNCATCGREPAAARLTWLAAYNDTVERSVRQDAIKNSTTFYIDNLESLKMYCKKISRFF